ncbi:MAG: SusC/RagA family TonB-linked outer membrane protein [Porphyromonadaceae bacterium]|nr:SusC/RagA family TonB-linked outer membrane protein [Porphyromonadaceae bacterium]
MDCKVLIRKLGRVIAAVILVFAWSGLSAQSAVDDGSLKTLKGVVLDAGSKKPISAAQISDLNKKASAVTDENGEFTIQLSSLSATLQVVAYDYNPVEVSVRGREYLEIKLYSDVYSRYFKNINTLSGEKRNSSLTISAESAENLEKTNAMTADEAMQYKLAGDIRGITRTGVTGAGASLFIRGINSLNANAQPLFIVDGVIWNSMYESSSIHQGFFSNTLDHIDVNDIESISVLKDGTSIYGSKAANGVVIIKTKRGTSPVTKINVTAITGFVTKPSGFPMMQGDQFRVYASDLLKTQGIDWNPSSSKFQFLEADPSDPMIYYMYRNNTDWSKEVYQNGNVNSYNINVTGGDDKALYYFSLGYTGNKGVVKTTNFQRINSRFNADLKFNNSIDLGLNVGFTRIERKILDDGMSRYSSPVWMSKIKSPILNPYNYTSLGQLAKEYARTDSFDVGNPAPFIESSQNNHKKFRLNIGFVPKVKITPELTFTTEFDYNIDKTVERRFVPLFYKPLRVIPNVGVSQNEINSQVIRNIGVFDDSRLTYIKDFDELSHIKAVLGWRFSGNYYELDYIEEHNSGANNNTTINGTRDFLSIKGLNNSTRSISNYLGLDYNYDYKYFINTQFSMDASSRFGNDIKGGINLFGKSWGLFPAINANLAWILSSESFMKPYDFISFLKIKAGYGLTGNDGILDNESMAYFAYTKFMGRANGLVLANLENPNLKWENNFKSHVGVDLILFDRITFTFDYFRNRTSDLLVIKDLPDVAGLGKYWANDGKLKNNGFEASLNLKALNLRDFKWEIGASVGHYKNEITELPNGSFTTQVYDGEVISAVGNPAGSFWGYKTEGVFATEEEAVAADLKILNTDGSFTNFTAGDMKFVDLDKNGIIDERDKQVIGNPNPKYYGNFTNNFFFNRFALNTVFTYSYGNEIYNYQRSKLEAGSDYSNQTSAMLRRWFVEGQVTDIPKSYYGDPMGNSRFSDRWIEDGSYLRLKTVTLSYDLPLKSDFIEGIHFWVSANNLVTFTKYLGLDPEFSSMNSVYYQGVDAGLIPPTKSYFLGVKFNL